MMPGKFEAESICPLRNLQELFWYFKLGIVKKHQKTTGVIYTYLSTEFDALKAFSVVY